MIHTRCSRSTVAVPVAVLLVLAFAVLPRPAGATGTVDPQAATLSSSASCSQGDIEITYSATGVERQITHFTAADGRDLHRYDVAVYSPDHEEVEYILSQTRQPPPAGTIVAVHVTIGASPPDAATGEFFVAWRCDTLPNDQGGNNVLLDTCVGLYGDCPTNAKQFADPGAEFAPAFTG
jgi:hypothetical protein